MYDPKRVYNTTLKSRKERIDNNIRNPGNRSVTTNCSHELNCSLNERGANAAKQISGKANLLTYMYISLGALPFFYNYESQQIRPKQQSWQYSYLHFLNEIL